MKYKVGDQVRVISKETADSIKDKYGDRRINQVYFNDAMYEQCGSLAEVVFAGGSHNGYRIRYIDGPYQDWHFLEEMLQPPELQQLRLQNQLIIPTNKFNEELLWHTKKMILLEFAIGKS